MKRKNMNHFTINVIAIIKRNSNNSNNKYTERREGRKKEK